MKKTIKLLLLLFVVSLATASCADAMEDVKPMEEDKSGLNAGNANSGSY